MREPFSPHRAAWHLLAVLIGASALITPPVGLAATVPDWLLRLWADLLISSGLLGMAAPLGQRVRVLLALAAERAALWVQAGTLIWIVASALYLRGTADGLGLVVYLAWIAADAVRERQIASALTKSRNSSAGGPHGTVGHPGDSALSVGPGVDPGGGDGLHPDPPAGESG